MSADKQNATPVSNEQQGQRVSARRRLLRGSFSAPVVMALSSGSALAASSSLRCVGSLPETIDNVPGNYFRVQRYSYTQGQTTTFLVKASDIAKLAAGQAYAAGKTWINVDDGMSFTISNGVGLAPSINTDKFVALRFSNTALPGSSPSFQVTGLSRAASASASSGSGRVMSASCWSSFA